MAGTISMAGIGSGLDLQGMIDGLVTANSTRLKTIQSRSTAQKSASTAISSVSTQLSRLKTATDALSDATRAQSYAVKSSDSTVSASIIGAAANGKYSVEVVDTAKEYRAYSDTSASLTTALAQSGTMTLRVGTGTAVDLAIDATDTLSSVITKINGSGLGVQATSFFDGTNFRMQLRGSDTGAGNEVYVTGLDLGVNAVDNAKQQASSAHIKVDGFDVYSKTNQLSGAVPGVTLNITAKTTTPLTVEVAADPAGLQTKLQAFIDNYNNVMRTVHSTAGYGSTKASNEQLAGDSALRSVTGRLNDAVRTEVAEGGEFTNLRSIGITVGRDGSLSVDSAKLSAAVSKNAKSVTALLSGGASGKGAMDVLSSTVDSFVRSSDGLLTGRRTSFDDAAKRLDKRADSEQDRLSRYRTQLEKQFSNLDTTMSNANATRSYLSQYYGTK